jgi:aldehyde dehydrogenase (NAD+)
MPTLNQRLALLRDLDRLLTERRPVIEAALAADFRKPVFETMTSEIKVVRHEIRSVSAAAPGFFRPRNPGLPLVLWPGSARVVREPRGRVLVLSPWNFPFQLSLVPMVGAVAAGNSVVLKPSELTPATASVIEDLVSEVFPSELVRLVQGGAETATSLLNEPWGLIFFTGSPAVGRIVARAAAETFSPAVLELGGKSPAVVLDGADITLAARRIVWGKVMNAGQTCVAPDYALVPRNELGRFVDACGRALEQFFPHGAEHADYAGIIHDRAFDRLKGLIDPGKLAWGGGSDRSRRYLEPTVLAGVVWSDAVMKEEIFGPILPVLVHEGPDDALRQITQVPDPLAAYVFGPAPLARRVLAAIPAGGGAVNDVVTHFIHHGLPFGGLRGSGSGQYHGRWSLETFTRPRGTLAQTRWDWPFRYPPYTAIRRKIVDFLTH